MGPAKGGLWVCELWEAREGREEVVQGWEAVGKEKHVISTGTGTF